MIGGTSVIVKIVSQTDVDNAATAMKGRLDNSALTTLKSQMEKDSLFTLATSLTVGTPVVTSSPAVNEETTGDVTVTAETTYGLLGIEKDDLSQLVKKEAGKQIDTKRQAITNDGLNNADIELATAGPSGKSATMTVQSEVTAGPEIDTNAIKELAKGKKRGEIEKEVGNLPGVTEVVVSYKPFWVVSTPKASKKIKVVVNKTTEKQTISDSDVGL